MEQANASAGLDTIEFDIAGGGAHDHAAGAAGDHRPSDDRRLHPNRRDANTLADADNAVLLIELDGLPS
jgi:hypothetical protein